MPHAIDRLLAKCSEVDGCWVHRRPRKDGYVNVTVDKRQVYAHRLSYEHFVGEIPDGLHLDHLCRNRTCCNPWHLDPVPPRVNSLRGVGVAAINARKTTCSKGHEFDYLWQGHRYCLRCIAERNRRYRSQYRPTETAGWEYR